MAFDVLEYLSVTLACPGQQKISGSGKCQISPLQPCCQSGSKEQGPSRGTMLGVAKTSDRLYVSPGNCTAPPQNASASAKHPMCCPPLLSGSDRHSSAQICQVCHTWATQMCTFISVGPVWGSHVWGAKATYLTYKQLKSRHMKWLVKTLKEMRGGVRCRLPSTSYSHQIAPWLHSSRSPECCGPCASALEADICPIHPLLHVPLHAFSTQLFDDWFN